MKFYLTSRNLESGGIRGGATKKGLFLVVATAMVTSI